MICAPDSTHRPCDCGTDSPNCEVCDEQWPCAASAEAAIARVREWHAEHCDECNDTGPCPTIRAIEGELT